ncbi:MAG: sensor histidine kinase, partial [Planctomycetota bacterium]
EEDQPHIYEPGRRGAGAQCDGIGLGLATVKAIALAHGGEVGVTSCEGEGSVFWIDMPPLE